MADDPAQQKKPEACSFVIFGVTGDLAHRLVIPALYNLASKDLLPDDFCVVGVARKAMSNDELRTSLLRGLHEFATRPVDDAVARRLLACVTCIAADPNVPGSFENLDKQLDRLESERKSGGNRLYYLATPPNAFAPISRELGRCGMLREHDGVWRRLVIEKPFGTDLASAKALNDHLLKVAGEQQIYRIDHYLGKETVQNILVLRFANGMFEPIWNRNHIDHVQITVEEKLGVGHRGSFYDATGALRDMLPNHLFQLLSLVAMEPPARFDAHAVRSEKAEVLTAIQMQSEAEALQNSVRGQYTRRPDRRCRGRGFSQDRRHQPGQHDGNLRRAQADHRQLALGRRAVLSADRQGPERETHGSRDQVQAGAVRDVPADAGGSPVAELSGDRHRADRRHRAAIQCQGPGSGVRDRRRRDGFSLPGFFQGRAEHGL